MATVSARIGIGRVTAMATTPQRASNAPARSCSRGVTRRRIAPLPARPTAKPVRAESVAPRSERSVPPATPNSAPCAVITRLEGTGRKTSATSSTTPPRAANGRAPPNNGAGSCSNAIPVDDAAKNITSNVAASANANDQ
jgi:hypothetical protein